MLPGHNYSLTKRSACDLIQKRCYSVQNFNWLLWLGALLLLLLPVLWAVRLLVCQLNSTVRLRVSERV